MRLPASGSSGTRRGDHFFGKAGRGARRESPRRGGYTGHKEVMGGSALIIILLELQENCHGDCRCPEAVLVAFGRLAGILGLDDLSAGLIGLFAF